ncbi:hypothetical protein GUITHDRAFT_115021 [Guillardia theta CCMP2712]|uniref:PDZ domain-containing protein n=1 Tax=Guillardia theta (strain CCMP2712) TaxID=905079 RepID=L1IRQ5_GUITC|nr:hypothetical protein GUITHDRAFT_115021 [Guillardia theta CCMP2712]EKX38918.1 hypothetical protein GUITHDRAFT_115021 [Guillardia theta CCMP2712]|eukprot:XP_005825898.1 hypothetical protein GUITHDRAFT_115021 [Guillardia theta CCMP2712]
MSAGIGLFLTKNVMGQYTVTKITPGGPAARARSVSIGDILMQVNGRRLDGLGLDMTSERKARDPDTSAPLKAICRSAVFVTSILRGGGSREVSPRVNNQAQTPREQVNMGYEPVAVNSAPNLNGFGEHQWNSITPMTANQPPQAHTEGEMTHLHVETGQEEMMKIQPQHLFAGAPENRSPNQDNQFFPNVKKSPPNPIYSNLNRGAASSPNPMNSLPQAPPQKAGLGMTLRNDMRGDLRITDIAPNGPADNAKKFKRMDIITTINGRNVRGMSVVQARDLIMGPVGSSVIIGILREFPGQHRQGTAPGQFLEVPVTRSLQNVPASRDNASNPKLNRQPMPPAPQNMNSTPSFPSGTPPTNMAQTAESSPDEQSRMKRANPSINAQQFRPQVNEAMCGIGVFIERTSNGLLTIKQISPDGPASRTAELHAGDFLVAINGHTTLGMPMQQPDASPFSGMMTPDTQSSATNGLSSARSMPSTARSYPPGPHPYTPTFNYLEQPIAPVPEGMANECGVGLKLIEFDGAIIIQRVFPEGPAGRSGLVMKGDLLHRVDYQTLAELTIEQIRPLLKGPYMSSVVLGLIKPKYRLRVNVRLQREFIADEFEAKDIPALPRSQDLDLDGNDPGGKEQKSSTPSSTPLYSLTTPVPVLREKFIPRGTGPDVVL